MVNDDFPLAPLERSAELNYAAEGQTEKGLATYCRNGGLGSKRTIVAALFMIIFGTPQAAAEGFKPDSAMTARIAARFNSAMGKSGINGVGRDVMKCYDDNLDNATKLRECVVYDTAALIVDQTMVQIFTARGINISPATLYTERVFVARQNTYGRIAFKDNTEEMKLIGPAAQKIVEKVLPR